MILDSGCENNYVKKREGVGEWDNVPPKTNKVSHFLSLFINPLKTRNLLMVILANSEEPDEMRHMAAFHQGLHCLLGQT